METQGDKEIARVGRNDQLKAGTEELALATAAYWKTLKTNGLTRAEATTLSCAYITALIGAGFQKNQEDQA